MTKRTCLAAGLWALALIVDTSNQLSAATLFSSDFTVAPSQMEVPTFDAGHDTFVLSGGDAHYTSDNGGGRAYARTVDGDYTNFQYMLTFTNTDLSLPFIGVGDGNNDGPSGEPGPNNIFIRINSPGIGGAISVNSNGFATLHANMGTIGVQGTNRALIRRNGDMMTFAIDVGYTGVFVGDLEVRLDLTSTPALLAARTALNSSSHLFFGTEQSFLVFDDILVTAVPEPSSFMLLGLGVAGLFQVYRRRQN